MPSGHKKLFIPGPVEVSQSILDAMATPMIGHRSSDFQDLFGSVQEPLKALFQTERPVFISTSSAWGLMECAIRNLCRKRVLNLCCGAFSDKWYDVSKRCGKEATAMKVDWGKAISPAALNKELSKGEYDLITVVHNETSTGVMNPLHAIASIARNFPDVMLVVDTVSSFSVVPIAFDELGIDFMLAGCQKALALPPGMSLFAVSEQALERSASVEDRGYYFDLHEFEKNAAKNMTPSTPTISHIFALAVQLKRIFSEGLEQRFERHAELNEIVSTWVTRRGFEHFADENNRSKSLVCVKNNLGVDVAKLREMMAQRHNITMDGGYGKIKGKTFRISNMGDETLHTINILLGALDSCLDELL